MLKHFYQQKKNDNYLQVGNSRRQGALQYHVNQPTNATP